MVWVELWTYLELSLDLDLKFLVFWAVDLEYFQNFDLEFCLLFICSFPPQKS